MFEMSEQAEFAGATHRRKADGLAVKATCWRRDGDHPAVERYPIERRQYKGLLVNPANPKAKVALVFGDWIVEDARGRMWPVGDSVFSEAYESISGA
jgi:hypothetical protein